MGLPVSVEKMTERRGVLRRSGAVGGSALLAGGAVGSAVLLSLFASPAGAVTTVTVDTNADGVANASDCTTPVANSCSLRDALAAATTDGDIIVFDAALSGQTISLSEGLLAVGAGITITGLGSANLTIDAGRNSRVFYIYTAASGAEVVMSGLSIIGGDTGNYGGGIYDLHDGDLTLTDVSITGCVASYGGGIHKNGDGTNGTIEIVDSTISDNYAYNSAGGLYTDGVGDLIITNSTFDGNIAGDDGGAGEFGNAGNITITDSTFSNNTADGKGGALYFTGDVTGNVSISGSSFSDNAANNGGGGAIYADNDGSFTISSSTFSGNFSDSWGGALYMGSDAQVITITDSLFVDNSAADNGGALDFDANDQIVTINNSTFVGNSSDSDGGAIWKDEGGSLTINMSTITENSAVNGGGVWFQAENENGVQVTITGTILAGNTGTEAADDLGTSDVAVSPVATVSDSILGVVEATITVTASNNIDATALGFVLGLGALFDNGGATRTMALLTGSPAIDAGPATVPTFAGNDFDQRGTPYVRVYNGQSDIGAFELQPEPTPATTTTTVASDEPVAPAFTG
ncbi:Polymorphic outer membrane protein repeat [Acidimicrobiia bacterium]